MLSSENADFAQVVVGRGDTANPPNPRSRPVAPLRAISGTEDNRLYPHLQILTSMSQGFHDEPTMGTAVTVL